MANIEHILKEVIVEKSGVDVAEITPEADFEDDLNISELEFIEILEIIEEKLEIEGLVDEMDEIITYEDLVERALDKAE